MILTIIIILIVIGVGALVTTKVIIPAVTKNLKPDFTELEELPSPAAIESLEPQLLNRYQSDVRPPQYIQQQPPPHIQHQPPQYIQQQPSQHIQQQPPRHIQQQPPQHIQQQPPRHIQQQPPRYIQQPAKPAIQHQLTNQNPRNPLQAPYVHHQSNTSHPQLTNQQPIPRPLNLMNQLLDQIQSDAPQAEPRIFYEFQTSLEPTETVLSRLQRSLKDIYIMPPEYNKLAAQYIGNKDQVYQRTFILDGNPNMEKITSFGIALLHHFANKNQPSYLTIVEHLISKIDNQLPEGNDLVVLPTKWNQKYYFFSVRLTRMLAMFEILGTTKSIKTICHKRICQITPYLWKSLNWMIMNGIELAWIAIPRLITNFLNDTEMYVKETRMEVMSKLKQVMKVQFLKNVDVLGFNTADGIWVENSCIFHGVATYWPIVESAKFYASVFRALGFEADIDDVTEKILNKILHPSMDIIPLGLFGRQPDITIKKTLETNWPGYRQNAKMDVGILPISGLGVFKSEDFVFWIRVQRWYLTGYECDQVDFELAGGWIQMRKLYLKNVKYSDKRMTWQKIKMQPGVFSYEDGSDDFRHLKPYKEEARHYARDVVSHIGTLMDDGKRVLYWKNKYMFISLFGESEITEFGVCTDNGLVMRMEVRNLTGKTLKIRLRDDDASSMAFDCQCSDSKQNCNIGFVTVSNNDNIVVNWRQVFKRNVHPQEVTRDPAGGHMTFRLGRDDNEIDKYVIESKDDLHFVIKNSRVILAGSFEQSMYSTIEYGFENEPILFEFNPHTLMFKATR